jgi:hypothetical protein
VEKTVARMSVPVLGSAKNAGAADPSDRIGRNVLKQ